jgi:uncharacterized membrane protein
LGCFQKQFQRLLTAINKTGDSNFQGMLQGYLGTVVIVVMIVLRVTLVIKVFIFIVIISRRAYRNKKHRLFS